MSTTKDHGTWKREHKQWLSDHKKWLAGHTKLLHTLNNFKKTVGQHKTEVKKLGNNIKKHEKMMMVGKRNHSDSMHKKFKKAHLKQNTRHKLHAKANKELVHINQAIEKVIRYFNHH